MQHQPQRVGSNWRRRRRSGPRRAPRRRFLWTLNGTCWNSLSDFLATSEAKSADLGFAQEAKLVGEALARAQRWAKQEGWRSAIGPASYGIGGGLSSGVAVFARRDQGLGTSAITLNRTTHHRIVFARWQSWIKTGIDVASLYLISSEGLSSGNVDLLDGLGCALRQSGRPFILGGDWNLPPSVLDGSGWLTAVRGVLVVPAAATTVHGTWIDYFVVHESIANLVVGATTWAAAGTSTHWPVGLELRAAQEVQWVRTLASPAAFPRFAVQGCRDSGCRWLWLKEYVGADPSVQGLEDVYAQTAVASEDELITAYGLDDVRGAWRGRAWAPEERWVKPCYQGGAFPKASAWSRGWRGVAQGLARLAAIAVSPVAVDLLPERCGLLNRLGQVKPWTLERVIDVRRRYDQAPAPAVAFPSEPWRRYIRAVKFTGAMPGWAFRMGDHGLGYYTDVHGPVVEGPALDADSTWLAGVRACWQVRLQYPHLADTLMLTQWAAEAGELARREEQDFQKWRGKHWKAWVRRAVAGGAALAHGISRDVAVEPLCPVVDGAIVCGQAQADATLDEWLEVWGGEGIGDHLPPEACQTGLPLLAAQELEDAGRSFKWKTGLAADRWHPRNLAGLSRAALTAWAFLFMWMECLGHIPVPIDLTVMVGLLKPEGGHRLIGLLAGPIRWWGRARRRVADAWEQAWRRPYFVAAKGFSAEAVTWRVQCRAGAARARGKQAAAFIGDLKKAYELVRHPLLAREAAAVDFCLQLLRVILAVYGGPRRLVVDGAVTRVFRTVRGIIAGCTFATTLLKVFMVRAFDYYTQHSAVPVYVYIDDVSLDMVGHALDIALALPAAIRLLLYVLIVKLQLAMGWPKCYVLGSCTQLRAMLKAALRDTQIGHRRRGVLLGVDRTVERQRAVGKQGTRFQKLYRQRGRLRWLQNGAPSSSLGAVGTAGPVAAVRFGAGTTGWADARLEQVRAFMGGLAFGEGRRSITLGFLLGQREVVDPALFAVLDPLSLWVRGLLCFPEVRGELHIIARAAVRKLECGGLCWKVAVDPAEVLVLSLQRAGWRMVHATRVITERDEELDLLCMGLPSLRRLLERAVQQVSWQHLATEMECPWLNAGACLRPLQQLVAGEVPDVDWNQAHRNGLRAVILGQLPNQAWLQE